MADDPNPALRAELVAALAVLAPQIRGLHDLALVSISADLAAEINKQILARERRRDLINIVIQWLDGALQALNALQSDGYPALAAVPMADGVLTELHGQKSDFDAASDLFTADNAVSFNSSANTTDVVQPVPGQT